MTNKSDISWCWGSVSGTAGAAGEGEAALLPGPGGISAGGRLAYPLARFPQERAGWWGVHAVSRLLGQWRFARLQLEFASAGLARHDLDQALWGEGRFDRGTVGKTCV